MRRSDGRVAIGIGEVINIGGFHPAATIQVGDKTIIYSNHITSDLDDSISLSSMEDCTWGFKDEHYRVDYLFPLEHQRTEDIIQQVKVIPHEW